MNEEIRSEQEPVSRDQLLQTVQALINRGQSDLRPAAARAALNFQLIRLGMGNVGRYVKASEDVLMRTLTLRIDKRTGDLRLSTTKPLPARTAAVVVRYAGKRADETFPAWGGKRLNITVSGKKIRVVEALDDQSVPLAVGVPTAQKRPRRSWSAEAGIEDPSESGVK